MLTFFLNKGMACGLLGNTPPVFGIYTNFFPVLVYILLGTSKHLSMGKTKYFLI